MQKISITIAIKGKENLPLLKACLKSLVSQKYPPFEIILVGNSNDIESVGLSENPQKITFKKIYANVDKSEARNLGILNTQGDYILYLDHDMEASTDLLSDCIKKSSAYDAVIIPEHGSGGSFWSNCRKLEKKLIKYDLDTVTPRFFKKSIFAKNEKPFDIKFGLLDEWGFNVKIKEKNVSVGISDAFVIVTESNLSILKEAVNKFKRGLWMKNFYLLDKDEAWRRVNPIKRGFVFYSSRLEYLLIDPVHFIGLIVLKTIDLVAFSFGYLYGLISYQATKEAIKKNIVTVYDELGGQYLKEMYMDGNWNQYVDLVEKEKVIRLLGLDTDKNLRTHSILDLGMGPGRWSKFFLDYSFGRVTGCDISSSMVKYAKESISDSRFSAYQGDMTKLPFDNDKFSEVFCFRALKYVPEYQQAIEEMGRVLRPRGTLVIEVSNKSILNNLLKFTSQFIIKLDPKLKNKSKWRYYYNVTFFSRDEIRSSFAVLKDLKIVKMDPLFVLPSIRMPYIIDKYGFRLLVRLDKFLTSVTPQNLFTRSWVVVFEKNSK